jgi:hypothetical protein
MGRHPDARTPRPPPETPAETLARFRIEAPNLAAAYVSNEVVGFRRIRFMTEDTLSDVVTNWRGWAEAEFINKIGGVSLTNVDFRFGIGRSGKILYCDPDFVKQSDELRGVFWNMMGITNRPPDGWPALPGELRGK